MSRFVTARPGAMRASLRILLKVTDYNGSVQEMGPARDVTSRGHHQNHDRLVLADIYEQFPLDREMCDEGRVSVFGPQLGDLDRGMCPG